MRLIERLRADGIDELTLAIDEGFRQAVGTDETVERMRQPGFWGANRPGGNPDWNMLWRVGLEVVPVLNADGEADRVTFRVAQPQAP